VSDPYKGVGAMAAREILKVKALSPSPGKEILTIGMVSPYRSSP